MYHLSITHYRKEFFHRSMRVLVVASVGSLVASIVLALAFQIEPTWVLPVIFILFLSFFGALVFAHWPQRWTLAVHSESLLLRRTKTGEQRQLAKSDIQHISILNQELRNSIMYSFTLFTKTNEKIYAILKKRQVVELVQALQDAGYPIEALNIHTKVHKWMNRVSIGLTVATIMLGISSMFLMVYHRSLIGTAYDLNIGKWTLMNAAQKESICTWYNENMWEPERRRTQALRYIGSDFGYKSWYELFYSPAVDGCVFAALTFDGFTDNNEPMLSVSIIDVFRGTRVYSGENTLENFHVTYAQFLRKVDEFKYSY